MYLDEYNRLFDAYRDLPVRLLEIGIQNGGSLEVWHKFFCNADKLVGCDNDPVCAQLIYEDPKITVVAADANSEQTETLILELSPRFDIIIDDGSHQSGDIVRSFARYFPHLCDGGLYVAEDLHCSYWQQFEGGLFHPDSSISFFKRLTDIINHEHWGIDKTRCELLSRFNSKYHATLDEASLTGIHSIEFVNSMCVIRKARPDANLLGSRLIVGTEALVCSEILPFHGSSSLQMDQVENLWSSSDSPIEAALLARTEELAILKQIAGEHDVEIARLKQTVEANSLDYLAQLALLRQQLETTQLEMAEQERGCSQQLLDMLQGYELQLDEQKRQHVVIE
jgi:hypothetical protein